MKTHSAPLLHLFTLLGVFGLLHLKAQAQLTENHLLGVVPWVDSLTFLKTESKWIRLSDSVDLNTLSSRDKFLFQEKEYVRRYSKHLNASDNLVTEIDIIRHKNMFPSSYVPASSIRIDETGIKSYYTEGNDLFPEGWIGNVVALETSNRQYAEDPNSNKRYHYSSYTPIAQEAYDNSVQTANAFGLLAGKVFQIPDSVFLQEVVNGGGTVYTSKDTIEITMPGLRIFWDLTQMRITIEDFGEETELLSTSTLVFRYHQALGANVLVLEEEVIPGTFDNGDCYEKVRRTIYSEYDTHIPEIQNRALGTSSLERKNTLKLFPNPGSGILNIEMPTASREKAQIVISDLAGSLHLQRQMSEDGGYYRINIASLPSGMYIVTVVQGGQRFSTKFIKQ